MQPLSHSKYRPTRGASLEALHLNPDPLNPKAPTQKYEDYPLETYSLSPFQQHSNPSARKLPYQEPVVAMLIDSTIHGFFKPRENIPLVKEPFIREGAPEINFRFIRELLEQP